MSRRWKDAVKGLAWALSIAGCLIIALASAPAAAQPYGHGPGPQIVPPPRPHRAPFAKNRPHFYLGPHGSGLIVLAQSVGNDRAGNPPPQGINGYLGSGGGFGVVAGFKLHPVVSLELKGDMTFHGVARDWDYVDFYHMHTWGLNIRLNIPLWRSTLDPYFVGGFAYSFLGRTYSASSSGIIYSGSYWVTDGYSWNAGFGMDFWLSRRFTLGGRIVYQGIRYAPTDDADFPWNLTIHALTLVFIPSWHF